MAKTDDTQRQLKALLARRHPLYEEMLSHWEFLEASYAGGRDWFKANIFRYLKEGDQEYKDRVERAYRFNHTREVVDLVDKYLFKIDVARDEVMAPESVKRFWKNATLSGLSVRELTRRISNRNSTFGRVWIVVDRMGGADAEENVSVAEDRGRRTYAYIVEPEHALDYSYDDYGDLNWILLHEQGRDDADPLASTGKLIDRYRLWTRDDWTLFTVKKVGNKVQIETSGPHLHKLGMVPVFPSDCVISDDPYKAASLIDDVAYLDRAVTNYLSNLDAIIQDQTFSQLAMPAQAMPDVDVNGDDLDGRPSRSAEKRLQEMGTKRIFTYDAEGGTPMYLSPDVKQAELILKAINKIINEIYHTVGLAGERTKEDNSQGIDNSSGVAKAYDFERVNALLASKADSLELTENRMAKLVAAWNGEDYDVDLVSYPDNFDVRGLYDEFEIAARLSLIEAPDGVRRLQMESVVDKLFPQLDDDTRKKFVTELRSWPPKFELMESGPGGGDEIRRDGNNQRANQLVNGG